MSSTPKIIDLYSGVGGLSLGAARSGFDVIAAVEREERIINSHKLNFPKSIHICSDVSTLKASNLRTTSKLGKEELAGLIGGPPCQGFSTMGKRRIDDDRNNLFVNFFKLAAEINPVFFLAENVPGILNEQYSEIRKKASKHVEKDYHLLAPIKISANDYGAATTRTRIFFIGIRKDIANPEAIPLAIKANKSEKSVFVQDALYGLPSTINEEWLDYNSSWQKVEGSRTNYLRSLNKLVDGIGDQAAIKRLSKKTEVSGCFGTKHSKDVAKRYGNLKPGEQDQISKSQKLNAKGFCPTLRAGTDNTRGSYQAVRPIHPDQPRVITPREAARLQGFPDWFQFHTTKWHSFRQIGNSVCPIAAERVLSAIKQGLSM